MSLSLQTEEKNDEIRLLWDGILDILLERIHHKSISTVELAHLAEELNSLLRAIKGKNGVWGSVIDVVLYLLRKDATITDLRAGVQYSESTIYRALARLELVGFAIPSKEEGMACMWAINREKCPVLYRACRQA